jgi:hypothetical protein
MRPHKCPNCGNANPKTIEDNGARPSSYDYTLLCVARVKVSDRALTHADLLPDQIDANGLTACGMQWCPNE